MKTIIKNDDSPARRKVRGFSAERYQYALCFILLMLLIIVACEHDSAVPQFLIGKWTTAAPDYADRYLKFTEHTLTYGIGGGEEVSHTIDKIDSKRVEGGIEYTLYYKDAEGEKWTLSLTYRLDLGGALQLKHRKNIWEKEGGS